jgi:hypothetical protein
MYQFTGIRSVSDGESSGSAFTLTGSFNGTAIFTGVASVPGTSYPADGLHISSLGTSAEVMIANSVIWGYSTATVTDNSGTLLLDPNVVYRTGAIGSPVSVTQALGISQGGTAAKTAATALANLGGDPIPNSGELQYYVSNFGNDSNSGLSWGSPKLTIAGALSALGSAGGVIHLGRGTWTISSADGNGNAVTLGIYQKIKGIGRYLTTININCAVTWGIQCSGAACEVSDLTVECGSSGTCTYGLGVQGPTTGAFSAEECLFERVIVGAGSGTMTNGFALSPISSAYNQDIAETHLWRVFVSGVTNACFLLGSGTVGNILNTYMYGCGAQLGLYGVYCFSTNFIWNGGTVQHNGTDFYFYGNCDAAESVIQNLRSENSGALAYSEPNTGGQATVEFKNIMWGNAGGSSYNPVANGQFIYWGFGGVLNLSNISFYTGTSGAYDIQPVIYLNGGTATQAVVANGLISSAPFNELFVSQSPYSTVTMIGYIQLNSSTDYTITDEQPMPGPVILSYQNTTTTTINSTSYHCMQLMGPSFSPMTFGAVGNGTADDTVAVQAAFTAAAAVQGIVDLGTQKYKTSSAITFPSFVTLRGSSISAQNNTFGGIIINTASDIFNFASNAAGMVIENCGLVASGGHVFNAGTSSISYFVADGVWINQESASHCIWYQTGGYYIGNVWGARKVSTLQCSASATISPWYYINTTSPWAFNDNYFGMMRAQGQGCNVPFFGIYTDNNTGISEENTFDQIIFEVCNGGGIAMTGAYDVRVNMCANWDQSAITGNFYSFSRSTAGDPCGSLQIRGGRAAVTEVSGYYDIYCDTHCYDIIIDTHNSGFGTLINSPASQTTILNTIVYPASTAASTPITAPSFVPGGDSVATGSLAAARYLAATTGGAPATGTYKVGDVIPDQTGRMYICTATPATFVMVGISPNVVTLTDGSTIAVNAALGNDFRLNLTGNGHTISNPTHPSDGQRIIFQITQGSGAPHTISWGTAYQFSSAMPPLVLSTTPGDTDIAGFIYNISIGQWLYVALANGFT